MPMGKKRYRRRRRPTYGRQQPQRQVGKVIVNCPGGARPGIDPAAIACIQRLDQLLGDLRKDVGVPSDAWDEVSAVKRYMAYLSMLVDVGLTDIVISAIHNNDLAVTMKQRMLVEYSARGLFYSEHPDYALHLMTIEEKRSVRQKYLDADPDSEHIPELTRQLEEAKARFGHVADKKPPSLKTIMHGLMMGSVDPAGESHDAYVWLYAGPSSIMHGEPEGVRYVFERDTEGNEHPRVRVADAELNAMLVDAGSNALKFLRAFAAVYHPGNQVFEERLDELETDFLVLTLRHPEGRDRETLDDIREILRGHDVDPTLHRIAMPKIRFQH